MNKEVENEKTTTKITSARSDWYVVACSVVLMLVAWIFATLDGWAAVAVSALAVVAGAFALRSHNKHIRNLAISSVIASSVLLLVVGAFMIFLSVGLD